MTVDDERDVDCESEGHEWSEWVDRPTDLPIRKSTDVETLRWCRQCNRYEGLSAAGVKTT